MNDAVQYDRFSEWGNYRLGHRVSVGSAARANRGRHSGNKVHRIAIQEIVAVKDEAAERALGHATLGKRFLLHGKPVVFSSYPLCGCTRGQHASVEQPGAQVTCEKCGGAA